MMAACESTRWRASMGDNSIKLVVIKRPSFRRAKQIGQCGDHLQRSGVADPIIDALPHSACGNDFLLRSEEHTSELQSLMRISYAVFCLKKKNIIKKKPPEVHNT